MYSSNLTPRFVFTALRVTIIITIVVGFLTVLPTVTKSTETAIQQLDKSAPNSCRINYSCGHFQDLGTGLFGKVGSVTIHGQINTNFDSHTHFGIRLYDATTHTYYGGEYYATSPVFLDDSLWLGDISLAISTTSQDYTFKIPEQPILNPAHNYLIDIVFQSQLDGRTFTIFGSNNPESYPKGAWQSDNPNDIQDIYFIVELLGPKPPTDKDTDGDCLTDTQEFVFGTSPTNIDTDGDGLFDEWEVYGIDHENDCRDLGVFLPSLGANPIHKDIFLEVDWMDCGLVGGDCAEGDNHTHIFKEDAKNRVVEAFRDAPVGNPNGVPGITLHIDVSNSVSHSMTTTLDIWELGGVVTQTSFDQIKARNFNSSRKKIFHYALFAHAIVLGGASGMAERPGNDLLVTLGYYTDQTGTTEQQAVTLMHELGHNLGLRHGGGDNKNYKPNYISIMNYFFQGRGGIEDASGNVRLDYSKKTLGTINENRLYESLGIQDGDDTTYYFCPDSISTKLVYAKSAAGNSAIDWDCDNDYPEADPLAADINGSKFQKTFLDELMDNFTELHGHDDWGTLVYRFQDTIDFLDGVHENIVDPADELDSKTIEKFALDHNPIKIKIDIKPSSTDNPINLKSNGVIPVAIIADQNFNPSKVIIESILFMGSNEVRHYHFEDVNADGLADLILHFPIPSLVRIAPTSSSGDIIGKTTDKILITGEDTVKIIAQ